MEELIQQIQKQKTLHAKLHESLKKIAVTEEDPAKRVSTLRTELSEIEKYEKELKLDAPLLQNVQNILNKSRGELKQKEEELKSKFGFNLEKSLKIHNYNLEGNYPVLRASFYTFVIDISSDKVTIYFGPEMEKLDVTKAIPEIVVAALVKRHDEIVKRPFDEKIFLRMLKSAYQMYLAQNQKKTGDEAPIPEIHALCSLLVQKEKFRKNPTKENFTEYSRAMFSYDLSQLKNRTIDQTELRLITATRSDTRVSGDFLWIPTSDGTTRGETVSRIKFVEVI